MARPLFCEQNGLSELVQTSGLVRQLQADTDLLDIVGVGCISVDSAGKIQRLSSLAAKELGLDGREVSGRELSQYLTVFHANRDIFPASLQRLQQGEASVELPANAYVWLEGESRKFYVKGRFVGYSSDGKLDRVFFLFRNIEEELTREYILNMALSRTKIFPWYYDIDRNKMIVDARWFAHLGIPTQDCTLTAGEFAELVHPDERDGLLQALMNQIAGQLNKDSFIYRLRRKDGTWEWFEEQSVYLGEIDGAPYRIVGVCQSIQEHKNVESSLIQARDKAQESDRLKSAFLANMSHEIRTPLNAIVGFSNLLTSGGMSFSAEEAQQYVHQINTNSDQLLVLISDILDLSRIESNSMEFHYSFQSLNDLLSDIHRAQVLNMSPEVEFILNLPEKDTSVRTDPMRLKQVVNNLINNAIKFTAGGCIVLGYRLSGDGKQVELFVKDSGSGISEDKLPYIFERFYKADTFQKGTGLGLSICKSIMDNLGGVISVASDPGRGSCFTVSFPLKG